MYTDLIYIYLYTYTHTHTHYTNRQIPGLHRGSELSAASPLQREPHKVSTGRLVPREPPLTDEELDCWQYQVTGSSVGCPEKPSEHGNLSNRHVDVHRDFQLISIGYIYIIIYIHNSSQSDSYLGQFNMEQIYMNH